ncbi:MAG: CheA signal transduction histidine kinase [Myxococcaceae bacterium]|nr:CheA signal transduction histidine kinase [Myxococcaceae bacterium]
MATPRDKLLQQFRELVLERLEKIGRYLMQLEGQADLEAGKAALRELHGLKGEARMMGFADINSLVHEMEEVVRAAHPVNYLLAPASTDALLVASDAVTVLSGASGGAPPDLPRLLEWLKQRVQVEKGQAGTAPAASAPVPAAPPSSPQPPPPAPSPAELDPAPHPSSPTAVAAARVDASVRISQQSLDMLTSTTTSLVARSRRRELAAARRLQLSRELQQIQRMAEDLGPAGAEIAGRLARSKDAAAELHREGKLLANEELRDLTALSEEIQALRMMQLGVLFEPYPRMVRDLSRELSKEVDLDVEGEDTRVDRSVLESLREPLMHLVRNAIDHGLEERHERVEAGKSPRGHLTLHAQREGERLLLKVEDDGRGLDPARLREVGVRKGLVDAGHAATLSDAAALDLIFLPGFSSKDEVTDVSGRGVGLDVVRVKLLGLGGEITVTSSIGRGASFELRVPVSLTVAPLGRPALYVGAEVVPFASIASILGAAPERPATVGELVLLLKGRGQSAAIAIDRVLEERVQAIFPLKGILSRFAHLSGATPLADGSLALVLSSAHLVAFAHGRTMQLSSTARKTEVTRRRKILVVDDSPLTRELLSSLLEAVGYDIVNANDGAEAMERLGREAVDLVVTDLEMPKVDGLELTRRLKSHPTLHTLPVVIVTTRGAETDRRKGMEAGADGYITKGDLVRQDLVDVVSRLLA